jgi:hypothetical protein
VKFFHSKRQRSGAMILVSLLLLTVLFNAKNIAYTSSTAYAQTVLCAGEYLPVATPLMDLGNTEYIRMDEQITGFTGGLYPDGSNQPPPAHLTAGLEIAETILLRNGEGEPDPTGGKIGMISIGMSNASMEFGRFVQIANADPRRNAQLVIVNGALSNMTAEDWSDPDSIAWEELENKVAQVGLTASQVQVAWVKNTLTGGGEFPAKTIELQAHFEETARVLKTKYPNLKIAYYSSRTRSYTYERGLSPEPLAYETGFAVKWMIEKQINGDSSLNFDPARGTVNAPYLAWGPYLWADGPTPRSDGFTWEAEDMVEDCTHPSASGIEKIANLLMDFFTTHDTATTWFLQQNSPPPTPTRTVLPLILGNTPEPATPEPATPQHSPPRVSPSPTFTDADIPAGPTGTSRAVFTGIVVAAGLVIVIFLGALLARRR